MAYLLGSFGLIAFGGFSMFPPATNASNFSWALFKTGMIIAVIFVAVVSASAQKKTVTVISKEANLRATPDIHGVILISVKYGETFELIKQQGAWFLVQTPDYVGWLHGSTITLDATGIEPIGTSLSIPSGYIWSPDNPDKLVPAPSKVVLENLPPEKDNGYDVGYISVEGVFLRESPNSQGEILKHFSIGDPVVLLSRTKTNDWLNVIDIKSALEGWVYVSHLKIYLSASPKSSVPQFQETPTERYRDPDITITNGTDRTLTLKLGDDMYTIESGLTRTIHVLGGSYSFRASAPGVLPLFGNKYFSKGSDYTWRFYIETTYR